MMEAELPDGTVLEFPDGTSPEVMQRVVKQRLGTPAPKQEVSGIAAPFVGLSKGIGNAMFGGQELLGKGIRALGGIGKEQSLSDLVAGPQQNFVEKIGQSLISDAEQRKASEEKNIAPYKEQFPIRTGIGEFGGEVAATLPVGGLLAKGASAVPGVARAAPGLVEALRTGGMSAGAQTGAKALATRMAGGAVTGGVTGGIVSGDMEGAGTGAAISAGLPLAGAVLRGVGGLAKKAIGGTTGVGEDALTQAYKAGKTGGATAEAFTKGMRGQSNMDDVLTAAKQNLEAMGQQKQASYRQGMVGVKADKTVLDLKNIDQAVNDSLGMATFKGQIKNEKAAQALSQIKGEVDNWKSLDPAEFHTPEGLDALKQKIGGIVEEIPFEQKTARSAAGKVYDSIRGEISKQAPEYSKVMKDYSEASELIKEIEKSLSLGQKASADTAMRKLQSLMRNNVNTNYGQRTQLAEALQQAGGQEFIPALAGQALNSALPRGIQQALSGTGGAGLALTGNVPAAAGLAAVSSPRLMGETFYNAGKAAGAMNPALIEALRRGAYVSAPVAGQQ